MSSLREDVGALGRALGTVLREQAGEVFYQRVEQVRALVRGARAGEGDAPLRALLSGLSEQEAAELVRAFAWYFQLVNLAEEYERVRALAAREGPRPESLERALLAWREAGWSAERAEQALRGVQLNLTFTAHPTEMRRRTIRAHLEQIARDLPELHGSALGRITAHVEAMWNTLELRRLSPSVLDEVKGGLGYLDIIARALPELEAELRLAFERVYGRTTDATLPLRFSSWMGGDRDGNPYVTPQATRDTLALHAGRARALLLPVLSAAYANLSQHEGEEEPWRAEIQALHDAVERGEAVDLVGRLEAVEAALRAAGQRRSAGALLAPALTLARIFGRHLVSLDVREHAEVVRGAVERLLEEAGVPDYADLPEPEKQAVLRAELTSRRPLWPVAEPLPGELERAVGPLREMARAVDAVGAAAFGRYVVSMAGEVSDVLGPLILAREVGLRVLPVPLFETLDDLARGPQVVRALLALPEYRAILGPDVQEIMLGYSDSNKDVGFLAANWALHEAQRDIAAVCREAGVSWRFFHGRGTSIGRGGGPAARAISGQPGGTLGAGLRLTEQGEALSDKYSHPLLARRNLEQTLYGVLLASAKPAGALPHAWTDALSRAAEVSRDTYRAYVSAPDFLPFFEAVTPIHEIARLRVASRPVRREGAPTLSNLRAIPWVMAWTQNRAALPGWYGLGEGLAEIGPELAGKMYREWPFFHAMLDNAQMSLAKCDFLIFREYLRLAPDPAPGESLEAAYHATVARVEEAVGAPLLTGEPRLKRSIELRNPYIDPIHRLQVELLRRARALPGEPDPELERALLLSVQGIAAGMRNTG